MRLRNHRREGALGRLAGRAVRLQAGSPWAPKGRARRAAPASRGSVVHASWPALHRRRRVLWPAHHRRLRRLLPRHRRANRPPSSRSRRHPARPRPAWKARRRPSVRPRLRVTAVGRQVLPGRNRRVSRPPPARTPLPLPRRRSRANWRASRPTGTKAPPRLSHPQAVHHRHLQALPRPRKLPTPQEQARAVTRLGPRGRGLGIALSDRWH